MTSPADTDLLQAYLDDILSADERRAIEVRLNREPDFARCLLLLAREETVLRRWARATRTSDAVGQAAGIPFPISHPAPRSLVVRSAVLAVVAAIALVVFGVAIGPDGSTLAAAGWDRSIRLWDLVSRPRWWHRVWLQVGKKDNGFQRDEASLHNWVMANERMAAALKAKHYH